MKIKKIITILSIFVAGIIVSAIGYRNTKLPQKVMAYYENFTGRQGTAATGGAITEPTVKPATGGVIIAPTIPPDHIVAPTIQPSETPIDERNGFVTTSKGIYYYQDGVAVKEKWLTIDEKTYYFRKNGTAATGIYKINGVLYLFNKNASLAKNRWLTIDSKKYYAGENGQAAIGYKTINDKGYYFESSGVMHTGFININGKRYYFGKNGVKVTGKKKIGTYMCYFKKTGALYRKIDTRKKMVALTYDDGPSNYTSTILKVLDKYDSVATFFEVGNRIASYKSVVKKIDSMGCEIGNHTYEHKILSGCDRAQIRKQIDQTNDALKKVIGKKTIITRPPGGSHNKTIDSIINTPIILWSIDTLDWKNRNAASVTNAVLKNVKDGDIVLMHDLYESTADASKKIIPALVKKGYQLVTVSELSDCRKAMKNGGTYSSFPSK